MSPHCETLEDWLGYLEKLHVKEIDLGLDRVLVVFRKLIPRDWRARVVTVAGTNGKGSTVRWMERLLRHSGRTTGAYMSPHISRFNERISLNGEEVTDTALMTAFQAVEAARKKTPLTYFEFTTLAALWLFHEQRVEDLILEVGLGGRLDAVNIMDPDLAIITSIGLDHMDWLGDNRESIGFEKAGILRPGIPAVYGEAEPPVSVVQQASAQKVQMICWGRDFGTHGGGRIFLSRPGREVLNLVWPDGEPPLALVVALQAYRLLGMEPDAELLQNLLGYAALPGRFETLQGSPWVIADVGHNPHAAHWLAGELRRRAPGRRVLAVYAALRDKDAAGVAAALQETVSDWYLAGLVGPRAQSAEELRQTLETVVAPDHLHSCTTVADAINQAISAADPDDVILVFGSFLTVGAAREHFPEHRISRS